MKPRITRKIYPTAEDAAIGYRVRTLGRYPLTMMEVGDEYDAAIMGILSRAEISHATKAMIGLSYSERVEALKELEGIQVCEPIYDERIEP